MILGKALFVCDAMKTEIPRKAFSIHPLFTDGAVLQRNSLLPIWGFAVPGDKVSVAICGKEYICVADNMGKWMAVAGPFEASGPHELEVRTMDEVLRFEDILFGEVWLGSGQSNMDQRVASGGWHWCGVENEQAEVANARFPMIRIFSVRLKMSDAPCLVPASLADQDFSPPGPAYSGRWTACSPETVGDFSAAAYFFARELHLSTGISVGIVTSCYGASTIQSWISRESLAQNPNLAFFLRDYEQKCHLFDSGECYDIFKRLLREWKDAQAGRISKGISVPRHLRRKPAYPKDPRKDQHSPNVMFNGMIAPLAPFKFRGVVWYHGESNQPTANLYLELLRVLIHDWRISFGSDLFFLIVQNANVNESNTNPLGRQALAKIREAQLKASLELPSTALIVTIDLGGSNVHVRKKATVGERLARAASCCLYGLAVPYLGPLYSHAVIEDRQIRLNFRHATKLIAAGDLYAFIIAGEDRIFHWARAVIQGTSVVVSNDDVQHPVAVRYAWQDNPKANLLNEHGLPASPFRTDTFD